MLPSSSSTCKSGGLPVLGAFISMVTAGRRSCDGGSSHECIWCTLDAQSVAIHLLIGVLSLATLHTLRHCLCLLCAQGQGGTANGADGAQRLGSSSAALSAFRAATQSAFAGVELIGSTNALVNFAGEGGGPSAASQYARCSAPNSI